MEDCGFPEWDVCWIGLDFCKCRHRYVDGDIYLAWLCLLERPGRRDNRVRNDDNVNVRGLNHKLTICWHTDATDSQPLAVCYDCLCLIRTMISLSYDGDGALEWFGHKKGYDCPPAGELGYLPRCLCSPLVMDRMTQYLTEIKGLSWSLMFSKTLYVGGRRRVCTRGTPPEACSAGRISLTLIGRRASVGGSVSHTDWPRVIGAVDMSPGGVWIDYIRQALGDSQSIVAMPMTGSLVAPTLFSCRTSFVLLDLRYIGQFVARTGSCRLDIRVLLKFAECWIMDADGFSVVDNRAGVTFGVELYVPWDAPEAVVNISSADAVLLRNVPDVFGMVGRRDSATESRVLPGRDAHSVRVLVPDCRGLDQNFHDVTVVDMGDLPESHVSMPFKQCHLWTTICSSRGSWS